VALALFIYDYGVLYADAVFIRRFVVCF